MRFTNPQRLADALGVGRGDLVTVVGGGGKTTLMYRLVRDLREHGVRAAAGTTTKIFPPGAEGPGRLVLGEGPEVLHEAVARWDWADPGFPVLGRTLIHPGKVDGIDPAWAVGLLRDDLLEVLVLEGDGSARRPVKAPESWEPVVPAETTVFVAVAGLSCLGRPLGPDVAFRTERFAAVTGLAGGDPISAEALARLFVHPEGAGKGCPPGARAVAVLNQADDPRSWAAARGIAGAVLEAGGRFGRVVVARLAGSEAGWEAWEKGEGGSRPARRPSTEDRRP